MNLLLDTHVVIWWLGGERLTDEAREAIADPSNLVVASAASIWEMSIKASIGKLEVEGDWVEEIEASGIGELPVTFRHAELAGRLPQYHRDPFDRMIIAQAELENLTVVTRDTALEPYGIPVMYA